MAPNIIQKQRKPLSSCYRAFAVIIFVCFFAVVTVFGQTDYSDVWVDDSDPNNGFIVGSGVTEADYTSGDDLIGIETTLKSPNGRTVTGGTEGVITASANVRLAWDWDDIGEYFAQTTHQPLCTDGSWGQDGILIEHGYYSGWGGGSSFLYWRYLGGYTRCFASRVTSYKARFGISVSALYRAGTTQGRTMYLAVAPCNVKCPTYQYLSSDDKGEWIRSYVAWGPLGCANINLVVANVQQSSCYER